MDTRVIFYLISVNFITTFIVIVDKFNAKKNRRRIPENYFYILAILGGWLVGILTMKIMRHKTVKRSFQIKYFFSICTNLIVIGLWVNLL